MPTATERITELRENCAEDELPYISKSRLKTFVQCPRKLYYNYILGIRPPENYHMKKGSRIHLVFEKYYENLFEYHSSEFIDELPETVDDLVKHLPDDGQLWFDWTKPYIGNFISWELQRAQNVSTVADWLPVGIEEEGWNDDELIPWMGFADVIVPAKSVPEVNEDDGVVIVDFKTGKTPNKKYRDHGIYLEGEYYGMLFKDQYDVKGVAGYFPKNNDFIVSPLSEDRREFIRDSIEEIHNFGTDKQNFEPDTGPLCKWGKDSDEQCDYYSMCHAGKEWGGPADNKEQFIEQYENGASEYELAEQYCGGDMGAVYYWKSKFNL